MKSSHVAMLIVMLSFIPTHGWASGDNIIVQLTPGYMPRVPMQEYLQGRLGVLNDSFYRRYLVLAYRQLEGKPFKAHEIEAYTRLLPRSGLPPASGEGVSAWQRIASMPSNRFFDGNVEGVLHSNSGLVYFLNCRPDAFGMAARIYEDRAARFGKQSPAVQSWLAAQKQVFKNCSGRTVIPMLAASTPSLGYPMPALGHWRATIPKPAEATLPDIFQRDRAYQIATAHFYAGDFALAAKLFDAIAEDKYSPWREWAPYLAARSHVRIATLANELGRRNTYVVRAYAEAERRLEAVIGQPHLAPWHASARGLRDFLALRKDLSAARRILESRLVSGVSDRSLHQDLVDYLWSLDRLEYPSVRGVRMEARIARDGGLSDWILTIQAARNAEADKVSVARATALRHALDIWGRSKRASWAVAAIILARDSQSLPAPLHDQARKWGRDHPGYATYHMQRLRWMEAKAAKLGGTNQRSLRDLIVDDARQFLYTADFPVDGRNALRELILRHTPLLDEMERMLLVEYLPPIESLSLENPGQPGDVSDELSMIFSESAASWINARLSLADMETLLKRRKLDHGLWHNLAVAAWTRAVALGDQDAALRLSPYLASALPGLSASLENYRLASNLDRDFLAADILVRHPAMSVLVMDNDDHSAEIQSGDVGLGNWWCPATANTQELEFPSLAFPAAGRAKAREERMRLLKLDPATNQLARIVLARAKTHPDDPRIPEDLHRLIRATWSGCINEETSNLSKKMFRLLHGRYKQSPWTLRTKYHY